MSRYKRFFSSIDRLGRGVETPVIGLLGMQPFRFPLSRGPILAWLTLSLFSGCGDDRLASGSPNTILIVVDTLRPDFLGVYGDERVATPNIDTLGADGIVFENAFSPSPITAPSHAALFASRHPAELGVVNNASARIPSDVPLLAEILDRAGYDTGAAVAIAPIRERWGFGRGFDEFEERFENSWILNADAVLPQTLEVLGRLRPPLFLWSHLSDPHEPYNAHGVVERDAEVLINGKSIGRVSTSSSAPRLIDFELASGVNELEIRAAYPFEILRLSLRRRGWPKPTLDPEKPPVGYFTRYQAKITSRGHRKPQLLVQLADRVDPDERAGRYAREVSYVDHHVGLLIERLKTLGLYRQSLILFTADHGEGLGCHGHGGHVETLYDCMVRVPLIIKPPMGAVISGERRRTDLAGLVDVLPTILGALGIEPRSEMRGRDLLATGAATEESVIFLETHRPQATRTLFGLRGSRHSIIYDATSDAWEFYYLTSDPKQHNNLFDPQVPIVAEWVRRLQMRLSREARPLPGVEEPAEMDDETQEVLRSLGYL